VAAVPFVQWQKFVDPNEGSFWMEVPALAARAELDRVLTAAL